MSNLAHRRRCQFTPKQGESEAPPQEGHMTICGDQVRRQGQVSTAIPSCMDFTDVGVRHTIIDSVQLHHFIDISPSVTAIAKEARLCVIAIVAGWITTRVVASLCDLSRNPCDHCNSNCSQKSPNLE